VKIMMKLNKKEGIAVAVSLAVLVYLFFSGPLVNLFSTNEQNLENTQNITDLPETGVEKEDVVLGSGAIAASGDTLTVHYVGTLPNGRVFDSSYDRNSPISFTLGVGQVIRGWDEGVLGMREGGKRILKIAPDYGYGAQAVGAIPSNSHLIFEVDLLEVSKPQ
jgi:FKBP-type peptidyl-prolyl cis-trans isomerase